MFQTFTNQDYGMYSVERTDRVSNTFRITRTERLTRWESRVGRTLEVHVDQDVRDGKTHEDHSGTTVYSEAGKEVRGKKYNGYREAALRFIEAEAEQATA